MTLPSSRNALADEVSGQHAQIGIQLKAEAAFERNTDPAAQWFAQAALGFFIHWGISSVRGDGDLSWSMMARKPGHRRESEERYGAQAIQSIIPPRDYWAQADRFRPDRYDPHKWLAAAKKAGFRYAVLTTKHHDGFALWPSAQGDFNTRTHLQGRDLVGEYVEACRANGLKVGFYYSPPDWYFERDRMSFRYGDALPAYGLDHEPVTLTRFPLGRSPRDPDAEQQRYEAGFRAYLRGQVEELLTRYGKIDLLWFDGHGSDSISIGRIRELQPGIVINPRAHGHGDFATFECSFPKERPSGWWEYCHLWADGAWGYLSHEIYKPTGWALSELARTRAWGGNFLANVAPNARGELPEVTYRRLAELAEWVGHSGVSLLDAAAPPAPCRANVPVTERDGVRYLHAVAACEGTLEVEAAAAPASVRLLRDGTPLPWRLDGGTLSVDIPSALRTILDDVVEVRWNKA